MVIRAKYSGICPKCGQAINPGDLIAWERGQKARHAECPSATEAIPPADAIIANFTGQSRSDAPKPGYVFRRQPDGPILTVVSVRSQYIDEDGWSFGLMDESGWLHTAYCRPATDEEAVPLLAREREQMERQQAQMRVREIAELIRTQGERPDGPVTLDGERIIDTQNIYGGGDWFELTDDALWYVQNNGADGDDWSQNNIRTGGAGAIGWRIPRDEAFVAELRALEAVLDPAAVERKKPSAVRAYREFFSGVVDAAMFPEPTAGDIVDVKWTVWVRIAKERYLGLGEDGAPKLGARNPHGVHGPYPTTWGYIEGNHALALRYEPTPERVAVFAKLLPEWATLDLIRTILTTQAEYDARFTLPSGATGRYKLPGNEGWAATARDTIRDCAVWGLPLNAVEYTPGVEVVHVHAESRFTGRPWQLWSDGAATMGDWNSPAVSSVSKAAADLLGAALRQKWWQEDRRWRLLLDIESYETTELARYERNGYSSGEVVTLERLDVRVGTGPAAPLYRVTEQWWAMGEDGDMGETVLLYADETTARASFDGYRRA